MKKIFIITIVAFTILSCEKAKIEKNLEGNWIISSYTTDGFQNITSDTQIGLEFSDIKKDEGDLTMTWTTMGSQLVLPGVFTLTDDHAKISATLELGVAGVSLIWDLNIDVTETMLDMNGTYTYSDDPYVHIMTMKGSK